MLKKKNKILILGKTGQLGWELERSLHPFFTVYTTDRKTLDLNDPICIKNTVQEFKPEVIINAAAYTAVDDAETNWDKAHQINSVVPGILAEESKKIGACLIHVSTDYVFNGKKATAYPPFVSWLFSLST